MRQIAFSTVPLSGSRRHVRAATSEWHHLRHGCSHRCGSRRPPGMGIAPQSTRARSVTDSPSRGSWRGMAGRATARALRLLAGCQMEELSEALARSAGALLALANRSDLIDTTVVVGAVAREDVIFSSDRADMEVLLAGSTNTSRLLMSRTERRVTAGYRRRLGASDKAC